jgi:hypothetical protein
MFRISYGFQCRQGFRYIADSNTSALITGNDNITRFLRTLIFPSMLETAILKGADLLQVQIAVLDSKIK